MQDHRPQATGRLQRLLLIETGLCDPEHLGFNEPQMNLGLGYLAAALESTNARFRYHCTILQNRTEPLEQVATLAQKHDVLGFSSYSVNWDATLALKAALLQRHPSRPPTIIGGPHATGAPEEAARHFDYVVLGEGEETLIALLDALNEGKDPASVDGLAFARNGHVKTTPPRHRILDLDRYGPPRRQTRWGSITAMPPVPRGRRWFAPIMFSRGCQFACTYCTNASMFRPASARQHIVRDPSKVVDEIQMLQETQTVDNIYAQEEDIAFNTDFLIRFCREMIERRIDVMWCGMASTDAFNYHRGGSTLPGRRPISRSERQEIFALMREAGCYAINFGFERPGSERDFFRGFGRTWGPDKQISVISDCYNAGIFPALLLMICVPGESSARLDNFVRFLTKETEGLRFRFSYMYPFVGTVLRDRVSKGQIAVASPEFLKPKYASTDHPALAGDMTVEEMAGLAGRLEARIYGNPEYAERIARFARIDEGLIRPRFDLDDWRRDVMNSLRTTGNDARINW